MSEAPNRRNLIVAAVAVAAVLITAVTMLASRGDKPEQVSTNAAPAPAAAPEKVDNTGDMVWHAERTPGPAATEFQDQAGATTTLQAFVGKVLVVNFWATWCAPCVEELPTLDALQTQLGGDKFSVLAISQDREGAKVVTPFLEKNTWKALPVYLEPKGRFARDAKMRGLPTTLILDKQGREVGRLEGTTHWTDAAIVAKLKELIGETTP